MKLTKLLILSLFLSLKGFSQQAVLTSSGEKVVLSFLSSLGGTVSGTLTVSGTTTISGTTILNGIINTGTITNTGALINTGNLTVNGNGTITGTITAGAVTYPNTAGTNGQVLTTDGIGTASWVSNSVSTTATTDTASLSNRINAKLSKTDTASLSDRINAKLNSTVFPYYPGFQKGHIMYWNGSNWVNLNPGTAGQVLKMSSADEPVPIWGTEATTSTTAFSPCGAPISDIDGNVYNTVLIGAQCWTKENLRVRRYNNGRWIEFNAQGGSGGSSSTWSNSTIGAHAIYAHDSVANPSNLTKYGYLYNYYAAKGIYTAGTILPNDALNICPKGWHVPTDTEWTTLTAELGGESVAGEIMKSKGTYYWNSPNTGATNESGFSALPGGFRLTDGSFNNLRNSAAFWSATEVDADGAWFRRLDYNSSNVSRNSYEKRLGACIRCLKD